MRPQMGPWSLNRRLSPCFESRGSRVDFYSIQSAIDQFFGQWFAVWGNAIRQQGMYGPTLHAGLTLILTRWSPSSLRRDSCDTYTTLYLWRCHQPSYSTVGSSSPFPRRWTVFCSERHARRDPGRITAAEYAEQHIDHDIIRGVFRACLECACCGRFRASSERA